MSEYDEFLERLSLLISKNPKLIIIALSNIFTMRLIGNKTHGDLAEIAITEFINQYMYDYKALHVGKDLFRAKNHEEDIVIKNEIKHFDIPLSLKAYGNGPLQLSTDKSAQMFSSLEQYGEIIEDKEIINKILREPCFATFKVINILPLIYDEKNKKCNIMVFETDKAFSSITRIEKVLEGSGRKHPTYRFLNQDSQYICEVRYGGASANALQRGLWTNTIKAEHFFKSISGGWVDYSYNKMLIKLFSRALISSEVGHKDALKEIMNDIDRLKSLERI